VATRADKVDASCYASLCETLEAANKSEQYSPDAISPAYTIATMSSFSNVFASATHRIRRSGIAWVVPLLMLGACGGGGGSSSTPAPVATSSPTVDQLANICTNAGEKAWELAHLNDVYLFYRDIVAVDPNAFATPEDYFNALIVKSKDRFSFVEPQSVADAFFNAGQNVGYGAVFKLDSNSALRIGFVDAAGPMAAQTVARGATITTLNGTAVSSLTTTQLNALLFPTSVGVQLTLTVLDLNQTLARTISVSSANVTEDPVPLVSVIPSDPTNTSSPKVGYLLFDDHIATSEQELINAINTFKAAAVSDVVVDLRYNGGGFLFIASELATMLGGTRVTPGAAVYDKLTFNDKHPEKTNNPANTIRFPTTSTLGQTLPTLNLSRVFIITAPGTCSASETIINGLNPFVQVILIGGTTCGKPYGFIQTNNCGDAYFAIQFQGVNAVGFGDFTNGFSPTCAVADDFTHALGDSNEGRLSATLAFSRTGSCPVTAISHEASRALERPERTLDRPERQMLRLN
jgi:carboxyl-terminal processing protease